MEKELLYIIIGFVAGWFLRPFTEQFFAGYAMPQAPPQVLPAYPELIG